jgi:hypothetical protein
MTAAAKIAALPVRLTNVALKKKISILLRPRVCAGSVVISATFPSSVN